MPNPDEQHEPRRDIFQNIVGDKNKVSGPKGPSNILSGMFPQPKASDGPTILDPQGRDISPKAKAEMKLLADAMSMKTDVVVNLQKDDDGNVIFVQSVYVLSYHKGKDGKEKERRLHLLDFGWTTTGMINYVRQMQDFEREDWPVWVYEYYRKKNKCPECGADVLVPIARSELWDMHTPATFEDGAAAECQCGWKGQVHQLKP